MNQGHLLTIDEVAECIQMSKGKVKKYIRTGELQHARFGKCVRIRVEDLEVFIASKMDRKKDGSCYERSSEQAKFVPTLRSHVRSGGAEPKMQVLEKTDGDPR